MKSSLYATCAGHKLRPVRQVYSGFQNKIKRICIYDTPLSVSCFSCNRNGKVFIDFPEICLAKLPYLFLVAQLFPFLCSHRWSLHTMYRALCWCTVIISATIQTCDTDISNKKTRHSSPHGSCTPSRTILVRQHLITADYRKFSPEKSVPLKLTSHSTKLRLLNCSENLCASVQVPRKATKFILSEIDKNSHQCWLNSVSLLVP